MTRYVSLPIALAAVVTLSLSACGGGEDKSGAPSTPAAATPTPTVTPSTPPATEKVKRTKTELTKALPELSDLPTGFSQEKDEEDETKPFSSSSSKCKTLVKYLNADHAPGAEVGVHRSFSGGQEGPYIDFGLDSMGSEAKVADLQKTYEKAVASCAKVTMKVEGRGRSSMKVEQISAPQFGTDPFAFRLTGTSGSLRGLEFTAATAGVNDVIVSIGILAGQDGELDGATEAAVSKAQQILIEGT